MQLTYKVVKGHRAGIWYYEVYASEGGETAKIRAGNTPYSTKREAEQKGAEKVGELEAQYKARQSKKTYHGKHGDIRPNKKTTYGYKHGRVNEYHVETVARQGRYTYQNVNAYGQSGVRSAKITGGTMARGRAYKNVIYNRTRGRYVGKNRVR